MKRVLIIDDDEAVRDSFTLSLRDKYETQTAVCGEDGIAALEEKKFDLIFLDLRMPGMNGVETLMEIRKITKVTPVYIVTAFQRDFLRELANIDRSDHQYELLNKPVGRTEIQMIAQSVLEKKQQTEMGKNDEKVSL